MLQPVRCVSARQVTGPILSIPIKDTQDTYDCCVISVHCIEHLTCGIVRFLSQYAMARCSLQVAMVLICIFPKPVCT